MNVRFLTVSLVILGLALAGCNKDDKSDAQTEGQTTAQDEILIGAYLSLTGTTATFGLSTQKGVEIAVDEVNQAGGVLGKKIRLLTEDTQSKPEEAALATTKLITRDHVKALIGEIASSRTLAAAPIAQANKIPMITPGSTNPEVTKKGDYIFRVCYIDSFQGEVLAKFAYNSLNAGKVAILEDVKNDYSIGLAQFFADKFKELGGTIIATQAYSEGDADFNAQLTSLKSSTPDLIFVPGYYQEAALIVKQARGLNMTMPFLGGDGWDSNELVEIGGEAMNNTYFGNHYAQDDTSKVVQEFVAKFRGRYQNETPDAMAVLGYDAANILFDAIKRAGSDESTKIRDALATTTDYPGVAGRTTIDSDRNAKKSLVIIAINDGQLRFYESVQP
ncbi:MAG: ABC transporter substrate-binding protein [candidate division Zixibacteria bacterium]|nr:ABC transporter substrate-binding protein [candidate division Zixibacteria bacterium]